MRIVNGCLTIAAILVGLVIATYFLVNLGGMVRAGWQQGRMSDDVTGRLAEAVPAARDRQGSLVVRTGRTPDHAWLEQSCARDSNDAGWMVQSYREVCELTSGALWRVDSREEAISLSRAQQDYATGEYRGCESLGETPEGMEARLVTVGAQQPWCVRDSQAATRALDGERPVLPEGTWLLVETIGCLHWSVVFCDDPWGDDHAFGDAPK